MEPAIVVDVLFGLVLPVDVAHHHVPAPHANLTLALLVRVEKPEIQGRVLGSMIN